MNTTVTATGMQVQAKAEGGLLISATPTVANSWSNTAAVTLDKTVKLLPASTSTGETWYHAHSNSSSNFASIGYYILQASGAEDDPTDATLGNAGHLTVANENLYDDGSATIFFDENGTDSQYTVTVDDGFYLLTEYYIRSSGEAITVNNTSGGNYKALAINAVKVATASGSPNLDKSLRIGVVLYNGSSKASDFVVLAPVNGADGQTATSGTKATTTAATTDVAALVGLCAPAIADPATPAVTTYWANANTGFGKSSTATIPSNTSGDYLTAKIFVWFEGEDTTCISDNLTTALDSLSIEVSFKITNLASQYNDAATTAEPTT